MNGEPAARPGIGAPAAVVLGAAATAVSGIVATVVVDHRGGTVRLLHFTFSLLQQLAAGALAAWLIVAIRRLGRESPRAPRLAMLALAAVIALLTLPDDLVGLGERIVPHHGRLVSIAFALLGVLDGLVLVLISRWIGRGPLRLIPTALGVALAAASALVLPIDYPALHLAAGLTAAGVIAAALAGLPLPTRAVAWPASRVRAWAITGTVALAVAMAVPIPNAALSEMIRFPAAFLAPYAALLRPLRAPEVEPPADARAWFTARSKAPRPASRAPVLPRGGVVVLITIDATRADVVMSGDHDAMLPNLARLRADSVAFTTARAPSPQTVPSVTGIMTGKFYSQMYWSGGEAKHAWPAADRSVRFPALLREAGVVTVTFPSLDELTVDKGTVRGFAEETLVETRSGEGTPYWNEMLEAIEPRLRQAAADPRAMFLYAHFVDPHAPYTRGGDDCPRFICYVREVGLVDRAIGSIRAVLDGEGLGERSVLIVSADHGEAFGEHGTEFHANTLYEELLRVPLLVHGRAFAPHVVDTPVTLLDLGPTVLELYGVSTPNAFMGESLVGVLRGEPAHFTRPIAAESGRFLEALYFDDHKKVIRDARHRIVELYDLANDPGERTSLFDGAPDAGTRLGLLDLFFSANAFAKAGYSPPYRK